MSNATITDMFNVADYLKRVSGTLDTNVLNTQEISRIIARHTGITKDKVFFEIKDGALRTNLSPAEKMMLFMKKETILMDLAQFGVKDIR